jgi:hypothetical protein
MIVEYSTQPLDLHLFFSHELQDGMNKQNIMQCICPIAPIKRYHLFWDINHQYEGQMLG